MVTEYKAKLVYGLPKGPMLACGCSYCWQVWSNEMDEIDPDGWIGRLSRGMTLCPTCGNKRCPKATYHDHECTGSNKSGQEGSEYGDFRLPSPPDIEGMP